MIDRLELLVPIDVPKRKDVWRKHLIKPAKFNSPYNFTLDADLRMSLRVHYGHRIPIRRNKQHFKVDFTNTRLLGAADLEWRLTSLFETNLERALSFSVARIDFAADVYGVPVEWFKRHCRVRGKRNLQAYEASNTETPKGAITSVVFGKRPDLYRIYDRMAEKRQRGADILFLGARPPIVTRVERQCSGKAIPKELSTLSELFEHCGTVDPFPGILLSEPSAVPIADDDWPPQKWLMNLGLATAVRELGEAAVRARLNRDGGNAKRIFEKYSEMLRADSPGITVERLRELYRKSTFKQLNIPVRQSDGKLSYPAGNPVFLL